MSSLKNATYAIIITVILSIAIYSPVFYCFQANVINAPIKCYSKTEACRFSNDLIYACLTIMFPIILMLIFGLMTIINIQKVKSRVYVGDVSRSTFPGTLVVSGGLTRVSKKKLDQRLFIMLIIQIFLLSPFTLPQAIQKLYIRTSIPTSTFMSQLKSKRIYRIFAIGLEFIVPLF